MSKLLIAELEQKLARKDKRIDELEANFEAKSNFINKRIEYLKTQISDCKETIVSRRLNTQIDFMCIYDAVDRVRALEKQLETFNIVKITMGV